MTYIEDVVNFDNLKLGSQVYVKNVINHSGIKKQQKALEAQYLTLLCPSLKKKLKLPPSSLLFRNGISKLILFNYFGTR